MDIMQVPDQILLNQQWDDFLLKLESILDTPIKVKEIKKIIKIADKVFPSNQCILNHYKNKFSTETNQDNRSKWHNKDKQLLIWCVVKLHELDNRSSINPTSKDWDYLSQVLGVKSKLLNLKWLSLLKTNLKDAPWSQEENQLLLQIANQTQFKKNWTTIAIEFNQNTKSGSTRYAKQIRERWNNYLDPNVKRDNWSTEERKLLFQLVNQLGKKWSQVSQLMNGRTENQVKNHYHSILKYLQKKISKHLTEKDIIDIIMDEQFTDLEQLVYNRNSSAINQEKDNPTSKIDNLNCKQQDLPLPEKKVKQNEATIILNPIPANFETILPSVYPKLSPKFFVPPYQTQMKQSPSHVPLINPQLMLLQSPQLLGISPMIYNNFLRHNFTPTQDHTQMGNMGNIYSQPQKYDQSIFPNLQQQNFATLQQQAFPTIQQQAYQIQLQNFQQQQYAMQTLLKVQFFYHRQYQQVQNQINNPMINNLQMNIPAQLMNIPQTIIPALNTTGMFAPSLNTPKTPTINTPVTAKISQVQVLQQMQMEKQKIEGISEKPIYQRNLKVLQIQSSLKESLQ